MIARQYLLSWFFFDMFSIIPFEFVFQYGDLNRLVRLARIGKLYKLVRMAKLTRVLKIL
jgi:hypothetical protein